MTYLATKTALDRRSFLRGSGAAVALPLLHAMTPAFTRAASASTSPTRFVAMNASLGFHAPLLFPEKAGKSYAPTSYLKELEDHLKDLTLFSGLSHPSQNGNNGHASELTWLTSAQRPGLAGFKNTISLDQLIAKQIGVATRFPSLTLGARGRSLSWTSNGVPLPAMSSPSKLYQQLFAQGTEQEIAEQVKQLDKGKSVLDVVQGDAKALEKSLGHRDREKLDEYLSSVRDLETRLQQNKEWARKPKPKVDYAAPRDVADKVDILGKQRLMYDMIALALQTDSCRSITFSLGAMNAVPSNIPGVKTDWHNLSHHGKDEEKIGELEIIEKAEFKLFGEFLTKLKGVKENGKHLLDHTAILFGSNLGNASSHNTKNLPVIVAGGGFKHGSYVAHDAADNTPLCNLFVPLAQRMGVKTEKFGSSTKSTIRGLES
tara:strand:+ start:2436 stop:3728 length:1293 start_codon:yes stop_codon:yes gene_type:complete